MTRKRKLCAALVSLAALAVAGEITARLLGMGDPVLLVPDAELEYTTRPGVYHRYGRTITINSLGHRGPEVTPRKSSEDELRVLLIGDSVVQGGAMVDDHQTLGPQLRERLGTLTPRPVSIVAMGAGGWGPPNELACLKRQGLFDADVVVLMVSSHDDGDTPDDGPGHVVGPTTKPWSALWESGSMYVTGLARGRRGLTGKRLETARESPTASDIARCEADLSAMVDIIRAGHARPVMALLGERDETPGHEHEGYVQLIALAKRLDVSLVELRDGMQADVRGNYHDRLHPTAAGYRVISGQLAPQIMEVAGNAVR